MNLQELLTYVEEIAFKNSMFGYDKDEVDIQLDKICDEVEALVLQKDNEIEELKNTLARMMSQSDIQPEDFADTVVHADASKTDTAEDASQDMVSREQYDAAMDECVQLKLALEQTQAALTAAKEEAAHSEEAARLMIAEVENAQMKAKTAIADAEAAKAKLEVLQAKLDDQENERKNEVEIHETIQDIPVEEITAEDVPMEASVQEPSVEESKEEAPVETSIPATKDEAYMQYMRYADLLCKQLAEVEVKHDKIVEEANAEATKITEEANVEAAKITEDARKEAGTIVEEARSEAEEILKAARTEAEEIGQDYLLNAATAEKHCQELRQKEEDLITALTCFSGEIGALITRIKAENATEE